MYTQNNKPRYDIFKIDKKSASANINSIQNGDCRAYQTREILLNQELSH